MKILGLHGSPSKPSRSSGLLDACLAQLIAPGRHVHSIRLSELPAEAVLRAQTTEPTLAAALKDVAAADCVVLATPIYKAAYSGVLKAFLDLLPQDGLRGKRVLPLATAGSPAHLLALDYALRPVLAALGARDVLDPVYAHDSQLIAGADGYVLDASVAARLAAAVRSLVDVHGSVSPQPPLQQAA